jgi:hypothetical protein
MQQKVPIVSSSFQHRFASLNMRFISSFRARSSRCIYSPLSPCVHRPRHHLWSLLISGHHFMILSYYLDLSPFLLCQTLLLCLHLPFIVTIIVIWPLFHHQASFFCYHFPIFTVICHVIIILSPILILKPLMKNQGDGQQSRVTGPSSKVHLRL